MSDTPSSPETRSPPASPSRAPLWIALVLLAAAAGGAGYVHLELQRARGAAVDAEAWRLEAEALNARVSTLDRQLSQADTARRTLDARVGELSSNQRVIREELLGMGERAATIEDAVARLSDQRQQGEAALKLNEIEGLLVLADQRLQLARDREGARTAMTLALSALDAVDDPLYAGLALPLRAELATLEALPADPLPAIRRSLTELLAALSSLPRRPLQKSSPEEAAGLGRLRQALSSLVTVRRTDDAERALAGSAREAGLESLRLDLRLALLAAEARDAAALEAALTRARTAFARLFDDADPAVTAQALALQAVDAQTLATPLPVLGASLSELRALRGSRGRPLLAPQSVPADPAVERQNPETAPSSAGAAQPLESGDSTPDLELEPEDRAPEARPVDARA